MEKILSVDIVDLLHVLGLRLDLLDGLEIRAVGKNFVQEIRAVGSRHDGVERGRDVELAVEAAEGFARQVDARYLRFLGLGCVVEGEGRM